MKTFLISILLISLYSLQSQEVIFNDTIIVTNNIELNRFGVPTIKDRKVDSIFHKLRESILETESLLNDFLMESAKVNKINQYYYFKESAYFSEALFSNLVYIYSKYFEKGLYGYLPGVENYFWDKKSSVNEYETLDFISNHLLLSFYYDEKDKFLKDFENINDKEFIKQIVIRTFKSKEFLIKSILKENITNEKKENLKLILEYLSSN